MSIIQDLRYAVRALLQSPGYAASGLLSLGLGIGANTAIFTITNAIFLQPLPVEEPSRVLELFTIDHATANTFGAGFSRTPVSFRNLKDYRAQNGVFSGLAWFINGGATVTGLGKPTVQNLMLTSANYFDVLGVHAALGRTFLPDEDQAPGSNAVAVLSHAAWNKLYGGDRSVIGRTINLNAIAYNIIGVAPPDFKGTFTVATPDLIWVPVSMHSRLFSGPLEALFDNRRARFLNAFGRLKPNMDERQAQSNLATIAAGLAAAYPAENRGRTMEVASLTEAALGFLPRSQTMAAALALSIAVGLVLLIACANLANLTLARAAKRSREFGIRVALGASPGRLMRQLLIEAEVLAIGGGVLGVGIGILAVRLLWAFRPTFLQANDLNLALDIRVVLFAACVSLLTGILFGLAPLIRASRTNLSRLLAAGGRSGVEGGGRDRFRKLLVVTEIALAMIALAGAGIFVRSMRQAQRIHVGFETTNLAMFNFDLTSQQMTPGTGIQFLRSVVEKVASAPGVVAAAVATGPPIGGAAFVGTILREGDPNDPRLGILASLIPVSPNYFETIGVPLTAGRGFISFDRADSKRVAIISEATARHNWPGQNALSKRFRFTGSQDLIEVVGIARDRVVNTIGEQPQIVVYTPFDQSYQTTASVLIRTSRRPEMVLPGAMAAVQTLNPDLALRNPQTAAALIGAALWAPQMAAVLFGAFGLLAMLLAVIGVYGVISYMVLERTNEIGVRIALGATLSRVLCMLLGQSLRLAGVGVLLGILAALALTRLVSGLLFGISPTDPVTVAAVAFTLMATAVIAALIPAWRAARIDPAIALRE